MTEPETLSLALRAWTGSDRVKIGRAPRRHRPEYLVVLDTETDLSLRQRLLVGCYRYVRVAWRGPVPTFTVAEEGLVHPDGNEDARRFLLGYAAGHPSAVDPSVTDGSPNLVVLSRAEFCERMIWQACWRNRATLVGFNLPFDISRIALSHHEGHAKGPGPFVFRLWEHEGSDHRYRPNVLAQRLDNRRTMLHFGGVLDPPEDSDDHRETDDHFLDCRTLAFAHTNASHSLESACAAFGVPYTKRAVTLGALSTELVDYCREDVAGTTELARALFCVHYRHPVPVAADRAYSPSSVGVGYLRRMGLRPPRAGVSRLDDAHLAQAQSAFYGQRTEVRIRHQLVPVTLVDFSSQYATVCQLLDVWGIDTAASIRALEATDMVRRFLDEVDLDACFRPETWPRFRFFAEVEPDGDWLPMRADFTEGDVPRVGFGPLVSDRPLWYGGPDLVLAKLVTGRAPRVRRAWRLRTDGRQKLRLVLLGGRVRFDPMTEDLWTALVGARRALGDAPEAEGLKVIANALAYGAKLRADRTEVATRVAHHLPDGSTRMVRVEHPEDVHVWSFPPTASLVTSGGRFLLGMLDVALRADGGTWAYANTDSAAVVSTEHGGLVACPGGPERPDDGTEAVRALSWADLEAIRLRFESLNPTPDRELLKLEKENFDDAGTRRQVHALAVSSGRVFLVADGPDGGRRVVKRSEVNLGELRPPDGDEGFLDDFAGWAVAHIVGEDPGYPRWWDLPATTYLGVGTPVKERQLGGLVSPFGFAMGARQGRRAAAVLGSADADRVRLVAPLGDAATAAWVEVPAGTPVRVIDQDEVDRRRGDGGHFNDDEVTIGSYGKVLLDWLRHPEAKMLGPDGRPCRYSTRGLLAPRPVRAGVVHYIGKESNRLDEVAAGEITDPAEVITTFGTDEWDGLLAPVVQAMGALEVKRRGGGKREQVGSHLAYGTTPRRDLLARLRPVAVAWAAEQLASWEMVADDWSPVETLVAYATAAPGRRPCALDGCSHPVTRANASYCTCADHGSHRERAKKRRQRADDVKPEEPGDARPEQQEDSQ